MTKKIIVRDAGDHDSLDGYDVFICALGYEERSSYIARHADRLPSTKLAYTFGRNEELSFTRNRMFFEEHSFSYINFSVAQDSVSQNLEKYISTAYEKKKGKLSIAVDISSMSRFMIAKTYYHITQDLYNYINNFDFYYAIAEFYEPRDVEELVVIREPILPAYSGWMKEPSNRKTAILGLGYEFEQALAMLDHLEPIRTWLFLPVGEEEKFNSHVKTRNKGLIDYIGEENIIKYNPENPFELYNKVSFCAFSASTVSDLVNIVPFGPKIFGTVGLLVRDELDDKGALWRISSDGHSEPADVKASGKVVSLAMSFR